MSFRVKVPERVAAAAPVFRVSTLAVAGLLALFALTGLKDLDGLFKEMHGTGQAGYTMSGLADVTNLGPNVQHTQSAVQTWFAQRTFVVTDAEEIGWWYFFTDGAFIIGYWLVLLVFFLHSLKVLREWHDKPDSRPEELKKFLPDGANDALAALGAYIRAAWAGVLALVALVVFDVVENVIALNLVRHTWSAEDGFKYLSSDAFTGDAKLLWWATAFKLAAAAATLIAAGTVAWVRLMPRLGRKRLLFNSLFRLRLHIGVAAVLAGFLFAHEQMPDVIRRWSVLQLAWAVALTLLFALVVWVVARSLLVAKTRGPLRLSTHVAVALVVVGVGLGALDLTTDFNVGWGLMLPAAFFLSVLVLNLAFGGIGQKGKDWKDKEVGSESELPRTLAAAVLVVFGLALIRAAFGYAVYTQNWSGEAFYLVGPTLAGVLGALIICFALKKWWRWLPIAAGTAGAALGLFLLLALGSTDEIEPSVLVALGVLFGIGGGMAYPGLCLLEGKAEGFMRWAVGALCAVVALGLLIVVVANPWWWGQWIGGIGILAGYLSALALGGWLVVWIADLVDAPRSLRVFQLRRLPLVTLLVVWFVVASRLDNGDFHAVRVPDGDAADRAQTVDQLFRCWLAKNNLVPTGAPESCSDPRFAIKKHRRVTPLVVVASSGGGMRAAYWTSVVLDCAFELRALSVDPADPCPKSARMSAHRRSNTLFATSGISGGSLGLTSYAAYVASKTGAGTMKWIDDDFDIDSLSPSVAWWFVVEGPRALLHFDSGTDRAEVLERGWERANKTLTDRLFTFSRKHPEAPLLLLNSTSVEDGCRFSASVLDANTQTRVGDEPVQRYDCRSTAAFDDAFGAATEGSPNDVQTRLTENSTLAATRELGDFLCKTGPRTATGKSDIRLSTATLLTARFPFVSPAGSLKRQCEKKEGENARTFLVDGGYLEPSGASTIVELMNGLMPLIQSHNTEHPDQCVVPYMIQIDNGPSGGAVSEPHRPQELTVPLSTLQATRGARAANARAVSAYLFNQPFPSIVIQNKNRIEGEFVNRYAHFLNRAHPGPQAPLGWVLSDYSMENLRETQIEENLGALAEVRELFKLSAGGQLRCLKPPKG